MTTTEMTGRFDSYLGTARRLMSPSGLSEFLGRKRFADEADYEAWLEERDMTIIAATLLRLSDRQLHRIGLRRETLAIDIDDLRQRTLAERQIGNEGLALVEEVAAGQRIAAE